MASPKGFILYRIYYGGCLVYVGRTKQPLQNRIRGHMFSKPMHRSISIHEVTKIEYTELPTEADMNIYEIYYICKLHPPLNVDDKPKDEPTFILPDLEWKPFVPKKWDEWKQSLTGKAPDGFQSQQDRINLSNDLWELYTA